MDDKNNQNKPRENVEESLVLLSAARDIMLRAAREMDGLLGVYRKDL